MLLHCLREKFGLNPLDWWQDFLLSYKFCELSRFEFESYILAWFYSSRKIEHSLKLAPSSSPTEKISWNLITDVTREAASCDGESVTLSGDSIVAVFSKPWFNNVSSAGKFVVKPSTPSSDDEVWNKMIKTNNHRFIAIHGAIYQKSLLSFMITHIKSTFPQKTTCVQWVQRWYHS